MTSERTFSKESVHKVHPRADKYLTLSSGSTEGGEAAADGAKVTEVVRP